MRALWTRRIQFEKRKVQNQMFMDSIKFYPRFNWIYRRFDCKKIDLLSLFRLLLEEIKVLGSNDNFEELIWPNQGFDCIIIEVLWLIRDLIDIPKTKDQIRKCAEIKGFDYNFVKGLITKLRKIQWPNQKDQKRLRFHWNTFHHLQQLLFCDNKGRRRWQR